MIRITVGDLAKANGISREAATAMIQYLRHAGLIVNIGTVARPEGQKGRGESLYQGYAERISAHLSALKLA